MDYRLIFYLRKFCWLCYLWFIEYSLPLKHPYDWNFVQVQSLAKNWRILIVLKTWKMRQSLACQFLACQFSTAFFRNFSVQKLTFINKPPSFGVFYRNFWSKLKLCGIDRVSELLRKWFWSKIRDFDKAHQKFLEFWNFREFLENVSIFGERLYFAGPRTYLLEIVVVCTSCNRLILKFLYSKSMLSRLQN